MISDLPKGLALMYSKQSAAPLPSCILKKNRPMNRVSARNKMGDSIHDYSSLLDEIKISDVALISYDIFKEKITDSGRLRNLIKFKTISAIIAFG